MACTVSHPSGLSLLRSLPHCWPKKKGEEEEEILAARTTTHIHTHTLYIHIYVCVCLHFQLQCQKWTLKHFGFVNFAFPFWPTTEGVAAPRAPFCVINANGISHKNLSHSAHSLSLSLSLSLCLSPAALRK